MPLVYNRKSYVIPFQAIDERCGSYNAVPGARNRHWADVGEESWPSIRTRVLQDERVTYHCIILPKVPAPSRNSQVEDFLREGGGLRVRSPSRDQPKDRVYGLAA